MIDNQKEYPLTGLIIGIIVCIPMWLGLWAVLTR